MTADSTSDAADAASTIDAVRRAEAETKAMKTISRELDKLDPAAQRRVLNAFMAAVRKRNRRTPRTTGT